MSTIRYDVICGNCKAKREVAITTTPVGDIIDWLEDEKSHMQKIVSGRQRLDKEWGWQCLCGNNSLLTKQEDTYITNKANPAPQELDTVIKNLAIPQVVVKNNMKVVDNFGLRTV